RGRRSGDLFALIDRAEGSEVRLRLHLLFNVLPGLWACSNPACTELKTHYVSPDRRIGRIFSQPELTCGCGGRVLELLYCQSCGEIFLGPYRPQDPQPAGDFVVPFLADLERVPDRVV